MESRVKVYYYISLLVVLILSSSHLVFSTINNDLCVWNRGVSFGFFGQFPSWLLILMNIAVLIAIIGYSATVLKAEDIGYKFLLLFIIMAGTSNLIDRVIHSAVCDYIDLNLIFADRISFPVFNVNDAIIILFIILLFIYEFKKSRTKTN